MKPFNKAIKTALTLFALALAVFIIGFILKVFIGVSTVVIKLEDYFYNDDSISYSELMGSKNVTFEFSDISAIEITSDIGNITIKTGNSFKVEGVNVHEDFVCINDSGVLTIENERLLSLINYNNYSPYIEITVPASFVADYIDIEIGAGVLDINDICADEFSIDAGVGVTTIKDCKINNLDIDAGIGAVNIKTLLTGDSSISCGIGEIELTILGDKDDYYINADKGIGELCIDGEAKSSDYELNKEGIHSIYIDGGIGDFTLNFVS